MYTPNGQSWQMKTLKKKEKEKYWEKNFTDGLKIDDFLLLMLRGWSFGSCDQARCMEEYLAGQWRSATYPIPGGPPLPPRS